MNELPPRNQLPGEQASPWRVWVLEDDAKTRDFFVGALQDHADIRVTARAGTVRQALALLAQTHEPPDLLLADLHLPDGSGLQVMAETLHRFPHCDCLVITVFADTDSIMESVRAGAVGYILKDVCADELVEAVRTVKAGGACMTPLVARRMLAAFQQAPATPQPAPDEPGQHGTRQEASGVDEPLQAGCALVLSPREMRVLSILARGVSYREIAEALDVSVYTVQSHVKNLYRKLAVRSRGEAVFEASRLGLLDIGK